MSGFKCLECGRKFKTVKAAEKASYDGCPKCGGVDIDVDLGASVVKKVAPKSVALPVPPPTAERVVPPVSSVTLVAPDGRSAVVECKHAGGFWFDNSVTGEKQWVEVYESRSE